MPAGVVGAMGKLSAGGRVKDQEPLDAEFTVVGSGEPPISRARAIFALACGIVVFVGAMTLAWFPARWLGNQVGDFVASILR